jgi:hypothetical protein
MLAKNFLSRTRDIISVWGSLGLFSLLKNLAAVCVRCLSVENGGSIPII